MIFDSIKKTRSHRFFENKEIKEEDILKILEVIRYTASSRNTQDLRFSYVFDDESCKKIFSNISLGSYLTPETKPTIDERPRGAILISSKYDCQKLETSLYYDIGLVSQNISLMANEIGIGTCIIMSFSKKEIPNIFNLPENYLPKALIILGYPKNKVEVIEAKDNDIKFYFKDGTHYVPKLSMKDLIIKK